MEGKKTQNKNNAHNYSNSETYNTNTLKQKKRPALSRRRNTAIALSIISSAILAGIGYEVVSHMNNDVGINEQQFQAKVPLRILSEEDDYINLSTPSSTPADLDFDEEVNIIQQLTRHKNLQAKKIKELKEELEEAHTRIVQLKTDILIKGGEKEQYYRDQIEEFNKQLSNFEQQNSNLQAQVAVRDKLIESKRQELEKLSKVFTDTHDQLQSELSKRESQIQEQIAKTDKIFEELKKELALTEKEIRTPEDVRDALKETTRRIAQLETLIDNAGNYSLEANEHAEVIANKLFATEMELEEARETIKNLVIAAESGALTSQSFGRDQGDLIAFNDQQSINSSRYQDTTNNLIQKQQNLEKVESQLQQARIQYTNEKSRAEELAKKVNELESIIHNQTATSNQQASSYKYTGSGNYSNVVRQQERLIKDLQRNVEKVEKRNKELEQLLAESDNQVEKYDDDLRMKKLKQELFNSQAKIQELEGELDHLQAEQANSTSKATSGDHNGLAEMEEFYETKLAQLAKTNQILEEQLEEAEEYIMLTQDELSKNHEQILSLQNQVNRVGKAPSGNDGTIINRLTQQLQIEKQQRESLEQELTSLRERFHQTPIQQHVSRNLSNDRVLKDQINELKSQYQYEKERNSQLESQLETLARMTSNLQDELKAYETSFSNNGEQESSSKLRAKIAYLTTRLAQEKSKLIVSEEKLQEMKHTVNEMRDRNQQLEQQVHYR